MITDLLVPWSPDQTIWWVNVILHSLAFSSIGWLILKAVTAPQKRSLIAANAILLAGLAPWISAMLPQERPVPSALASTAPVITSIQTPAVAPLVWTVSTVSSNPGSTLSTNTFAFPSWAQCLKATVLLWFAISLVMLIRMVVKSLHSLRVRHSLQPLNQTQLEQLRAQFRDVPSLDRIYIFKGTFSPCVVGLFNPRLAIPQHAFATWTPLQWRWVLNHENTHLIHQDNLIHAILNLFRVFWWWNPFSHSLFESWTTAREQICDATALTHPDEAPQYAHFLLHIAETSCLQPNSLAMARQRPANSLRQRITYILANPQPPMKFTLNFLILFALTTTTIFVFITNIGLRAGEARPSQLTPTLSFANRPTGSADEVSAQFPKIHLQTRWIEITDEATATSPLLTDDGMLTSNQFQQLIRDLSQKKGINQMSAPSVSMNAGQHAVVEVTRETPDRKDFIGIRTSMSSLLLVDHLALRFTADLGEVDAPNSSPLKKLSGEAVINSSKIVHHRKQSKVIFRDGETHCLKVGQLSPGRSLYHFISPKATTSDGKTDISFKQASENLGTLVHPLPADSDQTLREMTITFQAVDIRLPLDHPSEILKSFVTPPAPLKNVETDRLIVHDLLAPDIPGLTSVSGVLTDDQYQTILRELEKAPQAHIHRKVSSVVDYRQRARINLPNDLNDPLFIVSGFPSFDRKVVEVDIECPAHDTGAPRILRSLTMWDGQTVVLHQSSRNSQSPMPRIIFISVEIVK